MKELNVKIKLYRYSELKGRAKEKAYSEHLDFYYQIPPQEENEKGDLIDINLDEMSPEDLKEMVEDSLEVNGYYFFENGVLADCVTYTGKHEKAGITEFKFQGNVYKI